MGTRDVVTPATLRHSADYVVQYSPLSLEDRALLARNFCDAAFEIEQLQKERDGAGRAAIQSDEDRCAAEEEVIMCRAELDEAVEKAAQMMLAGDALRKEVALLQAEKDKESSLGEVRGTK